MAALPRRQKKDQREINCLGAVAQAIILMHIDCGDWAVVGKYETAGESAKPDNPLNTYCCETCRKTSL